MSVCKWLIVINVIAYGLCFIFNPVSLILTNQGIWYTFITSIFLHANFNHLFSNMACLFLFSDFEKVIGKKNYLYIYFIAGIMGDIFSIVFNPLLIGTLGASGAVMGIIAASLINNIKEQKCLIRMQQIHKRAIYITYIFTVIILLFLLIPSSDKNINNVAHISGFISGAIVYCIIENKEKWYVKKETEFWEDLEEKDNNKINL